jgi:hypothetical protein
MLTTNTLIAAIFVSAIWHAVTLYWLYVMWHAVKQNKRTILRVRNETKATLNTMEHKLWEAQQYIYEQQVDFTGGVAESVSDTMRREGYQGADVPYVLYDEEGELTQDALDRIQYVDSIPPPPPA